MENTRPSWKEYFMSIAEMAAKRSTCLSEAKGAVIVIANKIVATGYSGAPRGIKNCKFDYCFCRKRSLGYGHGEGHNECLAVHAESNAILSAASLGIMIENGEIYCTHFPCEECAKLIINSGIKKIYYKNEYDSKLSKELLQEANIVVEKI